MLPILLFSIIGFAYSIPEASSCPNGTMQSALNSSICYFYVNINYTAEPQGGAAETFCMGYNGHLASATNAFVNNEIASYLKSVVSNPDDLIWIGGYTDFDVEHGKLVYKWKWTDTGHVFTYNNFQNGNDTAGNDLALGLQPSTGKWISAAATEFHTFICELPKDLQI